MLKIVERDWLISLRGTGCRFDKTNDYKGMKRTNDGKHLFLKTLWIDLFYYLLDLRELTDANDVHKRLVGALFWKK